MTNLDAEWWATVDRRGKVGSRHHVVPRFVLDRWADSGGQVWAKSKQDRKEGLRNVKDLGIKDFYTFVATDGQLDSSVEEVLSLVEKRGSVVLSRLVSPWTTDVVLTPEEVLHLAEFVAIQIARSPRRRREHELLADFYAKTEVSGNMPSEMTEDDLRSFEFVPHQNDNIEVMIPVAHEITGMLMERPVSVITLDRPLLFAGDEMVVLNTAGDPARHLPECAMTEVEFKRKLRLASRRSSRTREVRRIIHVYTTQSKDVSEALEVAMPISPRAVLLFESPAEWQGTVVRETVSGSEADELAGVINDGILRYSLDMLVGRVDDQHFRDLEIPERTALMAVCGSTGAAKDALLSVPKRLRPRRLDCNPTPITT
ncbi:DUF4238 domain-containing protein [Rhodococcoides fascians]|uniref:DUF4238 domain-containing protein n=1 Tax=Rhodococcoides fascians TaxID=1828 RepID=UPI00050BDAC3|nr:DUF4238 domain-containing protein [Rhodococcus fascians]